MEIKEYIVIRDVTNEECPWLASAGIKVKKGMVVYDYPDFWNCCSSGIMVSFKKGQHPSFEIPEDAVEENVLIKFSEN